MWYNFIITTKCKEYKMTSLSIATIAHVDAGKTTLSEALLYRSGIIKKQGRVDSRNTFLDTHELERERGITIFSKMARFSTGNTRITLLDTPGHVDFSAETERTLSVLDYAILVISGSEGVQSHTETLWQLLQKYRVPTFIFITKMDITGSDKSAVISDIRKSLMPNVVDFTNHLSSREDIDESASLCDEDALEEYLEYGFISDKTVTEMISDRKLYPCFFGSGLKLDGIDGFLSAIDKFTAEKSYPEEFAAKVYKIGHDANGNRLTYLRVTGGFLSNRQSVTYTAAGGEEITEKITSIRLYSGAKFEVAERIGAGELASVIGLTKSYVGMGLGNEKKTYEPTLIPVLNYRLKLPAEVQPVLFLPKLRELEEEEPLLHVVWNERFGEINIQIMGQVQTEVITRLIFDRYGVDVTLDDGRIVYKESVTSSAEGVGHFEPLRHYAEVHLLIEPAERGSGLVFTTACSENSLDLNWQRLILTHLEEKTHRGVLIGAPITDCKITLVSGRAHIKHTQGGDFRESTYRAVRQGLMTLMSQGAAELLEPYFAYRLELPCEHVGRAMSDLTEKNGTIDSHDIFDTDSVLTGRVPVSEMSDYANEVASYTHGKGRLSYRVDGYYPCHNSDDVIAKYAYDPCADIENTPDSVFCAHGAGFVVPWNLVPEYMHIEGIDLKKDSDGIIPVEPRVINKNLNIDEKELEKIMEREFGPIRRPIYSEAKKPIIVNEKKSKPRKSLYIIDGYNVIFAWDELSAIAEYDLEEARRNLCELLSNYKAFSGRDIILVFDAYNVKGAQRRKLDYNGLSVVYTKEGELGDTYIEKLIYEIGEDHSVRVITSDGLIQLQALRSGVLRMSAREFKEEILKNDEEIRSFLRKLAEKKK